MKCQASAPNCCQAFAAGVELHGLLQFIAFSDTFRCALNRVLERRGELSNRTGHLRIHILVLVRGKSANIRVEVSGFVVGDLRFAGICNALNESADNPRHALCSGGLQLHDAVCGLAHFVCYVNWSRARCRFHLVKELASTFYASKEFAGSCRRGLQSSADNVLSPLPGFPRLGHFRSQT